MFGGGARANNTTVRETKGFFWAVRGIEKKCPFEVILVLSWGDSTTPAFGVTIGGYDACMSEGLFVS